ncbi:MAG: FtsX-like permease family protein, partial [Flavobacteriales bacterium]|nr:FtsX-like permease family protein [Flavobacteriales bacterium]
REISFSSMAYFPKNGGTRLVYVRAVESGFPFYGNIETEPPGRGRSAASAPEALADRTLLLQFDAAVGDSLKVGDVTFAVKAEVLKVPGQSAITTTVAPPVFIPLGTLDATGLLQLGSRMEYKIYAKYPADFNPELFETYLEPWLESTDLRYDDVAERKESVGEAYADLTGFLNLTAFVALILGCIGVAGSVHIYLKEKTTSVAVLRCLGASGTDATGIFMVQVLGMGILGSAVGAAAGAVFQTLLPRLFADFLPFEVAMTASPGAIVQGILVGALASLLFALLSLVRIRKISPLKAIRASFESADPDRAPYVVAGLIALFIYGFAWYQLGNALGALWFTAGLFIAFGLLAGLAAVVMRGVRRFFPKGSPFVLRQGLANLYRPDNQTLILVVTIGLGTALIAVLFITQDLLLDKVKLSSAPENRPNMVLFDIQSDQVDAVRQLTDSAGFPVINEVSIVTMRLHSLRGRSVDAIRADTTSGIRSWVTGREYRVSYRGAPSDSETIIDGRWQGKVEAPGDSIFISLEKGLADEMKAELGDEVSFNVQGAVMKTYVGSIRKVDWQRMQTNFLVMFPEGVLEKAPKFHVILTRFETEAQSAEFQSNVVRAFPNVSVIDLQLILETVDTVLGKVSFVIRFMALFSIFTGILVLIGSVLISKFQRVRESVLLRTLGAQRHHILKINTLEYFILGSLASLSGIIIALIAGGLSARLGFETALSPDLWFLLQLYVAITGLTVLIGLSNSRDVVRKSPLEVLRKEG